MPAAAPSKANPAELLKLWKARPTTYVIEVFQATPDPWQTECLIHLADKPATLEEYISCYEEVLTRYRIARKRGGQWLDWAKRCLAVAEKKWTREWFEQQYAGVFGKVSVRSGHGVGKSTVMAWAALWVMSCFFPLKAGATAPTAHQLEDVLFAEVGKWYARMPPWFRKQLVLKDMRIEVRGRPKESFLTGKTARKEQPEALQGLHQENTAVFVDEATGVPDIVYESSEGIMTSESTRALLASNPTRTQGFFYDTHTRVRHLWHVMSVSCLDSPRVSQAYIDHAIERYGADSNSYRVRVLGEFPRGDDDAVIPLYMIEEAIDRDVEANPDSAIIWGLDPARFGDDRTALAKRKGNILLEPVRWWVKQDLMQTTGRVVREYEETPLNERPDEIVVDVNGMGAGVVDRMRESGLPVRGVNVAQLASREEQFQRQYSELWWMARDWFERGDCRVPDDPAFLREIVRPTYRLLSNGKILVESKSDVKKRVLERQSPDLAEAFILTFAGVKGRLRKVQQKLVYPRLGIV